MRVSIRFRDDVRTVAGTAASSRGHDAKYHDLRQFSAKPGKKIMKIHETCICIYFHVQYTRCREFDPSWNAEQVVYARTAPWTGQKKKFLYWCMCVYIIITFCHYLALGSFILVVRMYHTHIRLFFEPTQRTESLFALLHRT